MASDAADEDEKKLDDTNVVNNVNLNDVTFEIQVSKDGNMKWKMIGSDASQLNWDSTIKDIMNAALGSSNTTNSNNGTSQYRLKFESSKDLRYPILFYKNNWTFKDVYWKQLAKDVKDRILARKKCFIQATLVVEFGMFLFF